MARKKFGVGVLIGGLVGVAAGLLAAPKSGKETRDDLKRKAMEVRGSAERKLKDAHKELASMSGDLKTKAVNLKGKAQAEVEELSVKADDLRAKVKAAITSIKSGDDDNDDATLDKLLEDFKALKNKVTAQAKSIKGDAKEKAKDTKDSLKK